MKKSVNFYLLALIVALGLAVPAVATINIGEISVSIPDMGETIAQEAKEAAQKELENQQKQKINDTKNKVMGALPESKALVKPEDAAIMTPDSMVDVLAEGDPSDEDMEAMLIGTDRTMMADATNEETQRISAQNMENQKFVTVATSYGVGVATQVSAIDYAAKESDDWEKDIDGTNDLTNLMKQQGRMTLATTEKIGAGERTAAQALELNSVEAMGSKQAQTVGGGS